MLTDLRHLILKVTGSAPFDCRANHKLLLSGRSTVDVYGISSSSAQQRHSGVLHVDPANFVYGTNHAPLPNPAICSTQQRSYAPRCPIFISGGGQTVITISFGISRFQVTTREMGAEAEVPCLQ
jgi:hypothetical protein